MTFPMPGISIKPHDYDRLRWESLRVEAMGINPPGLISDPEIDPYDGTFLFASNQTNLIGFRAQMPLAWSEGTALNFHVHWSKTDSTPGAVFWELQYRHSPVGGITDLVPSVEVQTATHLVTPDNDTEGEHLISLFPSVDMTGNLISHTLLCTLRRVGLDLLDTYAGEARMLEIDIHYERDSRGSPTELIKTEV